jgi:hypothetical protein
VNDAGDSTQSGSSLRQAVFKAAASVISTLRYSACPPAWRTASNVWVISLEAWIELKILLTLAGRGFSAAGQQIFHDQTLEIMLLDTHCEHNQAAR